MLTRKINSDTEKLYGVLVRERPNTVGLLFYHGIGDCCMFLPSVKKLAEMFPETKFVVLTLDKQVPIFMKLGVFADEYKDDYPCDFIFDIRFFMSPKNTTKNDYCCLVELGIEPVEDGYEYEIKTEMKPIVGVHFQNTCLPDGANPSPEKAKAIWDEIRNCGCIPLEVHFIHGFANPKNKIFDFVDFTTRNISCSIDNLVDYIGICDFFFGVNSGPFFVALRTLGLSRVAMLEKDYLLETVVKSSVRTVNINSDIQNIKKEVNEILCLPLMTE
jgi:hypothetical protein